MTVTETQGMQGGVGGLAESAYKAGKTVPTRVTASALSEKPSPQVLLTFE